MADRVGQQLGNYRLIRLLGQGGFAEVYLGEHVHLNTQAAVKVLYTYLASEDMEQFRNEARTIARLEHPHIVRILDFGVEDGIPFLIMSYAPNGTLRQRHPRGVRLPLDILLPYVKQVADALQYAHDEKLIHRDIKPENMLLGRRNEVLLSDFGLATIAQSSQSQSRKDIAGTVTYMAPEQLRGKPGAASDQYALGVVIYEWLSGDYLFHGYALETAVQHMLLPPPPLREKFPTVPQPVEQVILRALEKDPHKRFESIQAFATALEQAISAAGETGASPPLPLTLDTKLPGTDEEEAYRTVVFASTPQVTPVPATPVLGHTLFTYRGHTAAVNSLVWSPDAISLASASNDQTVQVWKPIDSGALLTCRGHAGRVYAVTWSHDCKYLASAAWDATVRTWDAATGHSLCIYRGHTKNVNAVTWSPNQGNSVASGGYDQAVQVWDALSGAHIYTFSGHSAGINALSWSPNGKRVVSGSYDQTARAWDATGGGHVFTYSGHSATVTAVGWSPNGKRIASASRDGTIQVWDETWTGHIFARGKVITYRGHKGAFHTLAWSPNNKYIASGGKDGTVQLWDASTGGHLYTYRDHAASINTVGWSPDGKYIASGDADGIVKVWFAPST